MRKPEVGQTLYSLNIGNAARNVEKVLTPVLVEKVGNKYFTVRIRSRAVQYHISNWLEKTEYCANSKLYETESEWFNEKETSELINKARQYFGGYGKPNMSLSGLRKISEIIDEALKGVE